MRKFQDFVVEKKIKLKDDYNPCYYNFAQPLQRSSVRGEEALKGILQSELPTSIKQEIAAG
jgi:hypothetical protein